MRTLFRWLLRLVLLLVILAIVGGVVLLLGKDSLARSLAEKNLRDATGMDAKISRLEVGLLTPTVNMEGMRLYNLPEFGGGMFLEMPELRVEYFPEAIRDGKLRFKTVRLHIAEVHVVRGKDGKTNIERIQKEAEKKPGGGAPKDKSKTNTPGMDFGGIDTLYLTVGKLKITDLANPKNNQEIAVGLKDEVGRNLKSEAEIAGWFGGVVLKLYFQQMMRNPSDKSLRNLLQPPTR